MDLVFGISAQLILHWIGGPAWNSPESNSRALNSLDIKVPVEHNPIYVVHIQTTSKYYHVRVEHL